ADGGGGGDHAGAGEREAGHPVRGPEVAGADEAAAGGAEPARRALSDAWLRRAGRRLPATPSAPRGRRRPHEAAQPPKSLCRTPRQTSSRERTLPEAAPPARLGPGSLTRREPAARPNQRQPPPGRGTGSCVYVVPPAPAAVQVCLEVLGEHLHPAAQ